MEAQNGLRVLNLAMPDLLRQMENAIQFGNPVLLQVSLVLLTDSAYSILTRTEPLS